MYSISDLIQIVLAEQAEAVYLHPGEPPVLESRDMLRRIEGPRLELTETGELFRAIAPPDELSELQNNGLASFRITAGAAAEFRIMAFREHGHVRLEIRRVSGGSTQRAG